MVFKKKDTAPVNPEQAIKSAKRDLQRELMEAVPDSALSKRKKAKRKKQMRNGAIAAGALLIIYMFYISYKPVKQGLAYGLCTVFIELYVPYPHTLNFNYARSFMGSIRIWYSHTDAFGQFQYERIQCYMASKGIAFDKIVIGKDRELPEELVASYNKSIPFIMAHPPDLSYPEPLPDSLQGLVFEFEKFRKRIF